jgi:hypothetical protein
MLVGVVAVLQELLKWQARAALVAVEMAQTQALDQMLLLTLAGAAVAAETQQEMVVLVAPA